MLEREQSQIQTVETFALEYLNGRKDWDEPHTKAVVYYAGQLALTEGLDLAVIKAAAWLHDIGYFGLFENADSSLYAQVKDKKALHMVLGAKMAWEFFQTPEARASYTPTQVERIIHLVSVHDNLEILEAKDEIVLMEADTLGAVDLSRVTPTFNYLEGMKYIAGLKIKRLPRFQTALGKKLLSELLPKFEEYFEKMALDH